MYKIKRFSTSENKHKNKDFLRKKEQLKYYLSNPEDIPVISDIKKKAEYYKEYKEDILPDAEELAKEKSKEAAKYVKENPGKAAVVVPVSAAAAILAPVPGATELAFIGSSKGYDLAKKGINKAFRKNNKKYKK